MFEVSTIENIKIDALKSEHLREGVRPIMASINDFEHLDDISRDTIELIQYGGEFIDYSGEIMLSERNNIAHSGVETYVVSDCNANDKWSNGFVNCTGVVLVGTDKKTNDEISFLSHQDPSEFLQEHRQSFENDLVERIRKLLSKTEVGTVDAVVFGGDIKNQHEYEESINILNEICKRELGFEPVVLTGPSISREYKTSVYLDTQRRRLYLVRPEQYGNATNQSYNPSDIEKEKKKWVN